MTVFVNQLEEKRNERMPNEEGTDRLVKKNVI